MSNKKTSEIVKNLDAGLRHKSGLEQHKFVSHYCKAFRGHAYASADDSWNEFEKLITHVLGMYIYWKRFADIMKFPSDPRGFVNAFEDAEEQLLKDATSSSLGDLREALERVGCLDSEEIIKNMRDD